MVAFGRGFVPNTSVQPQRTDDARNREMPPNDGLDETLPGLAHSYQPLANRLAQYDTGFLLGRIYLGGADLNDPTVKALGFSGIISDESAHAMVLIQYRSQGLVATLEQFSLQHGKWHFLGSELQQLQGENALNTLRQAAIDGQTLASLLDCACANHGIDRLY